MCPAPFLSSGTRVALPGQNLCTSGCVVQFGLYSIAGQNHDISSSSPPLFPPSNFRVTKTCGSVNLSVAQLTHHLQFPQKSLGNSGAFQLYEAGPQGLKLH